MGSVTYKNQPAIDKTKGSVPLAGTSHIYRVQKKLWNDSIEDVLQGLFIFQFYNSAIKSIVV